MGGKTDSRSNKVVFFQYFYFTKQLKPINLSYLSGREKYPEKEIMKYINKEKMLYQLSG